MSRLTKAFCLMSLCLLAPTLTVASGVHPLFDVQSTTGSPFPTGGGPQALAKENAKTGVAEVNGTKLYYEAEGKGPVVVLVHGGLVDSRQWNDQMKEFAKRHR